MMVHRKTIIDQVHHHLCSVGIKPGLIVRGAPTDLKKNIQLAAVQTFSKDKRLDRFLTHTKIDYLIIDEAHHTPAKSYLKIIDESRVKNANMKLLGVTATPWRMSAKDDLSKIYNVLITSEGSVGQLIQQGYLSSFKIFGTPADELEKVKQLMGDYELKSLSDFMCQPLMVQKIIDSYERHAKGKTNIVFCVDTKHADDIKQAYRKAGYTAEYILADTTENQREKILNDFRHKKLQILITLQVLTEGFDAPDTQVIQLARPTKSLVLYLQMVGRGLRAKTDKSELIILDNANLTIEHGTVTMERTWSLEPRSNPNKQRKRKVIAARKPSGELTVIPSEMDGLELVEMDIEEYLEAIEDSAAHIQEYNSKIDEKAKDDMNDFVEWLNKNLPLNQGSKWRLWDNRWKKEEVTTYNVSVVYAADSKFNPDATWESDTGYIGVLEYKPAYKKIEYKLADWYGNVTINNIHKVITAGIIAQAWTNKQLVKEIQEKFEAVLKNLDRKKSIDDIEKKKREFVLELKKEYLRKMFEESEDKYFTLPKPVHSDFKEKWGANNSGMIVALKILSPTIRTIGNKVAFYKKHAGGWREPSNVKVGELYVFNTLKMCTLDRLCDYFIKGEWDFSEIGLKEENED